MSKQLVLIICITFAQTAMGTIQKPDRFFHNGNIFDLDNIVFPMEEYFERHPDKKQAMTEGLPWSSISTNLWRGHVATYQILDGKLVLKDLEISGPSDEIEGYQGEWISVMDRVFSDGETLQIDWFSDLLILPIGEAVYSFDSKKSYGKYLAMDIQAGDLLSEYVIYGSPRDIRQAHQQDMLEKYANRGTLSCQVQDPDLSEIYIGDCKHGLAEGTGIAIGRDDYRGEFFEGEVHGRGVYVWGPYSDWSSERHEGFFGDGLKSGFGVTTVDADSNHIHLEWYKENALRKEEKYVLRGLFVEHRFVLACESPAECQRLIDNQSRDIP